jgi:23S rRNA (pseudouridine1915-N3)-methyltransferase
MQITLATIGKSKPGPTKELVDTYIKRNAWRVQLVELEARKSLSGEALQQEEGRLLLEATAKADLRVALDERGKALTSRQFADQLQQWQLAGSSHVAFLIGGADGHLPELRQQCRLILNLGSLTWPHMLARAMLCEQLYRAWTLSTNHPYHRD